MSRIPSPKIIEGMAFYIGFNSRGKIVVKETNIIEVKAVVL
ncbi:hypothetical protein [Sporosarcina sp. ITBMC105]